MCYLRLLFVLEKERHVTDYSLMPVLVMKKCCLLGDDGCIVCPFPPYPAVQNRVSKSGFMLEDDKSHS